MQGCITHRMRRRLALQLTARARSQAARRTRWKRNGRGGWKRAWKTRRERGGGGSWQPRPTERGPQAFVFWEELQVVEKQTPQPLKRKSSQLFLPFLKKRESVDYNRLYWFTPYRESGNWRCHSLLRAGDNKRMPKKGVNHLLWRRVWGLGWIEKEVFSLRCTQEPNSQILTKIQTNHPTADTANASRWIFMRESHILLLWPHSPSETMELQMLLTYRLRLK